MREQTAAKHVSKIMKTHVLRKAKPCKSIVNICVFKGLANWMQDHGNQQNHCNKYMQILAKWITNPCKIDARKSDAKNMENDANMDPKWRST